METVRELIAALSKRDPDDVIRVHANGIHFDVSGIDIEPRGMYTAVIIRSADLDNLCQQDLAEKDKLQDDKDALCEQITALQTLLQEYKQRDRDAANEESYHASLQ